MKRSTIVSMAVASLASAQDASTTVSTNDLLYTIQTDTLLSPTGPVPSIITVPTLTISSFPGQTITSLPYFTGTVTNHLPPGITSQDGCTYVTAQGDPVFTIQTETSIPAGCTITVYPGQSSSGYFNTTTTPVTGRNTTVVVTTATVVGGGGGASSSSSSPVSSGDAQSGTSTTDAAPTPTDNPANKLTSRSGWIGVAVVAGLLAWL